MWPTSATKRRDDENRWLRTVDDALDDEDDRQHRMLAERTRSVDRQRQNRLPVERRDERHQEEPGTAGVSCRVQERFRAKETKRSERTELKRARAMRKGRSMSSSWSYPT